MPRLRLSHVAWVLALVAFIALIIGRPSSRALRTQDASNLKQIGQAAIIHAHENNDRLPEAADVWEYAYLLAQSKLLNAPEFWQSKLDPAWSDTHQPGQIFDGNAPHSQPDPKFRLIKPSVAVPVAKLDLKMPSTTPIAWTRGLQPDGTWPKHSPYGGEGGYIAFLGGKVAFYRNLSEANEQLVRFDGNGKTSSILDALPPGTRVSEYVPSAKEEKAWARKNRIRSFVASIPLELVWFTLLWAPFVGLSIFRFLKKKPGSITILFWPVVLTVLLAIIVPTVSR